MAFHQMTPQNALISPRTPRTFRKSSDPAQRSAAFAACMRGSMSSVRRGDFLFRTKLAPCIHVVRYRPGLGRLRPPALAFDTGLLDLTIGEPLALAHALTHELRPVAVLIGGKLHGGAGAAVAPRASWSTTTQQRRALPSSRARAGLVLRH